VKKKQCSQKIKLVEVDEVVTDEMRPTCTLYGNDNVLWLFLVAVCVVMDRHGDGEGHFQVSRVIHSCYIKTVCRL
jgi:hypothetical protein